MEVYMLNKTPLSFRWPSTSGSRAGGQPLPVDGQDVPRTALLVLV